MSTKVENICPLTPLQKGILYHNILEEKNSAYFEQMDFDIIGRLDKELIESAFNTIINKHEILRTAIVYKNIQEPKQVVLKERKLVFKYYDVSGKAEIDAFISECRSKDKLVGFDLQEDCLLRVNLIKMSEEKYRMILSFHHIILDGWSIGILFKELLDCYEVLLKGDTYSYTSNKYYSNYIRWLQNQDEHKAINYWKDYVEDYNNKIELENISNNAVKRQYYPEIITQSVGSELTNDIMQLAKQLKVTKNSIYETAWGIILGKYNDSNDVIFGKVVSGRSISFDHVDETMGLFINTIPKRIKVDNQTIIKDLIQKTNESNYETSDYEFIGLNEIQKLTSLKKDLINNILVFENYPIEDAVKANIKDILGFELQYVKSFEQTNYDLNVIISPSENEKVIFRYNAQVYEKEFINKLLENYISCIGILLNKLESPINQLDLILEKEKDIILKQFNNTTSAYPRENSISQIFERVCKLYPSRNAVDDGKRGLTYSELENLVDAFAFNLINKGIKKGDKVGLLLDSTIESVICILGILKAGAIYVAIDKKLPDSRIEYIINDSKLMVLITDKANEGKWNTKVWNIEEIINSNNKYDKGFESASASASDGACIIYTSGTLGKPKGTTVSHRNITRVILNTNYVDIDNKDVMVQCANYSFDGSLFNIFGALLNGAELVIPNHIIMADINLLSKMIIEKKVSLFFMTTSFFNVLVTTKPETLNGVRCVVIGGEVASGRHCKIAFENMKNGTVINGYGPTESTVFATAYAMNKIEETNGKIPIGRPISNTKVYIMDRFQKLQPIGVEGEICISGDGITNGYINNQELTNEKYIKNPFNNDQMLYKTGDIGKWKSDGNIEYCGRRDSLVKVRGFRVELEEIESQAMKNKKLKDVSVIAKQNNFNMVDLIMFYTTNEEIETQEIKDWLSKLVPSYMIPKHFVKLEAIPLNKNGKVDKGLLKDISIESIYEDTKEDEEISDLQKGIINVWKEVLDVNSISLDDDLYEIGGDSIKSILIYSKLQKMGHKIEMNDLVENSTIRMLSKKIEAGEVNEANTKKSEITLLNKPSNKKLILFPAFLPEFANEIMGKLLMENIPEYSIYIAEFFETDDLYMRYSDMLEEIIGSDDEILFVGYSFGGNISYEVAKELERRGIIIKNIILIDSYKMEKFWFADPEDLKLEIDKFLAEYLALDGQTNIEEFQHKMYCQMETYCNFINNYVGIYPAIDSSLYMILSNEPVIEDDIRIQWKTATRNKFKVSQGYGTHREMWSGHFLEKNIQILKELLLDIEY